VWSTNDAAILARALMVSGAGAFVRSSLHAQQTPQPHTFHGTVKSVDPNAQTLLVDGERVDRDFIGAHARLND
jgi:hypothetical protein